MAAAAPSSSEHPSNLSPPRRANVSATLVPAYPPTVRPQVRDIVLTSVVTLFPKSGAAALADPAASLSRAAMDAIAAAVRQGSADAVSLDSTTWVRRRQPGRRRRTRGKKPPESV